MSDQVDLPEKLHVPTPFINVTKSNRFMWKFDENWLVFGILFAHKYKFVDVCLAG